MSINRMLGVCTFAFGMALAGCLGDQIKANQTQLDQQQEQLDQLKQQVLALQTQRANGASYPAPGACDEATMREASRKGGERFSAGDFARALPYYQDAVTACPQSSLAQLNLARSFEATGDRPQALAHYRLAAAATGADADAGSASQARDVLARLGAGASH